MGAPDTGTQTPPVKEGALKDTANSIARGVEESSGGKIKANFVKEALPLVGAMAVGIGSWVFSGPLTQLGKALAKGVRSIVTGFGYFEKIPVIGGLFTALGKGVDVLAEATAGIVGVVGAILTFQSLRTEPFKPAPKPSDAPSDRDNLAPPAGPRRGRGGRSRAETKAETEAKKEIDKARKESERLREELEKAKRELERARQELEKARSELERATRDKAELARQLKLKTEAEAKAKHAADVAQKALDAQIKAEKLAEAKLAHEKAKADAEAAKADAESQKAEAETAKAEFESAKVELEKATNEADKAKAEAKRAAAEADATAKTEAAAEAQRALEAAQQELDAKSKAEELAAREAETARAQVEKVKAESPESKTKGTEGEAGKGTEGEAGKGAEGKGAEGEAGKGTEGDAGKGTEGEAGKGTEGEAGRGRGAPGEGMGKGKGSSGEGTGRGSTGEGTGRGATGEGTGSGGAGGSGTPGFFSTGMRPGVSNGANFFFGLLQTEHGKQQLKEGKTLQGTVNTLAGPAMMFRVPGATPLFLGGWGLDSREQVLDAYKQDTDEGNKQLAGKLGQGYFFYRTLIRGNPAYAIILGEAPERAVVGTIEMFQGKRSPSDTAYYVYRGTPYKGFEDGKKALEQYAVLHDEYYARKFADNYVTVPRKYSYANPDRLDPIYYKGISQLAGGTPIFSAKKPTDPMEAWSQLLAKANGFAPLDEAELKKSLEHFATKDPKDAEKELGGLGFMVGLSYLDQFNGMFSTTEGEHYVEWLIRKGHYLAGDASAAKPSFVFGKQGSGEEVQRRMSRIETIERLCQAAREIKAYETEYNAALIERVKSMDSFVDALSDKPLAIEKVEIVTLPKSDKQKFGFAPRVARVTYVGGAAYDLPIDASISKDYNIRSTDMTKALMEMSKGIQRPMVLDGKQGRLKLEAEWQVDDQGKAVKVVVRGFTWMPDGGKPHYVNLYDQPVTVDLTKPKDDLLKLKRVLVDRINPMAKMFRDMAAQGVAFEGKADPKVGNTSFVFTDFNKLPGEGAPTNPVTYKVDGDWTELNGVATFSVRAVHAQNTDGSWRELRSSGIYKPISGTNAGIDLRALVTAVTGYDKAVRENSAASDRMESNRRGVRVLATGKSADKNAITHDWMEVELPAGFAGLPAGKKLRLHGMDIKLKTDKDNSGFSVHYIEVDGKWYKTTALPMFTIKREGGVIKGLEDFQIGILQRAAEQKAWLDTYPTFESYDITRVPARKPEPGNPYAPTQAEYEKEMQDRRKHYDVMVNIAKMSIEGAKGVTPSLQHLEMDLTRVLRDKPAPDYTPPSFEGRLNLQRLEVVSVTKASKADYKGKTSLDFDVVTVKDNDPNSPHYGKSIELIGSYSESQIDGVKHKSMMVDAIIEPNGRERVPYGKKGDTDGLVTFTTNKVDSLNLAFEMFGVVSKSTPATPTSDEKPLAIEVTKVETIDAAIERLKLKGVDKTTESQAVTLRINSPGHEMHGKTITALGFMTKVRKQDGEHTVVQFTSYVDPATQERKEMPAISADLTSGWKAADVQKLLTSKGQVAATAENADATTLKVVKVETAEATKKRFTDVPEGAQAVTVQLQTGSAKPKQLVLVGDIAEEKVEGKPTRRMNVKGVMSGDAGSSGSTFVATEKGKTLSVNLDTAQGVDQLKTYAQTHGSDQLTSAFTTPFEALLGTPDIHHLIDWSASASATDSSTTLLTALDTASHGLPGTVQDANAGAPRGGVKPV